jgi:hypothetical protein
MGARTFSLEETAAAALTSDRANPPGRGRASAEHDAPSSPPVSGSETGEPVLERHCSPDTTNNNGPAPQLPLRTGPDPEERTLNG